MDITLRNGTVVRLDDDADLVALFEARTRRVVLVVLARLPVVVTASKKKRPLTRARGSTS